MGRGMVDGGKTYSGRMVERGGVVVDVRSVYSYSYISLLITSSVLSSNTFNIVIIALIKSFIDIVSIIISAVALDVEQ